MDLNSDNQSIRGGIFTYLLFLLVALYGCLLLLPQIFIAPFGHFLVVDHPPQKTDAIIVLLGGNGPERILQAKKLLDFGSGDSIVFGSGFRNPDIYKGLPETFVWPNSSTNYQLALESLGVDSEKIQIVDTTSAFDTSHELKLIGDFARSQSWQSITLVSSATHTRRSTMIWKRINPDIIAVPSSAIAPRFKQWWKHGHWRRSVGYEYGALVKESWAQIESRLRKAIN